MVSSVRSLGLYGVSGYEVKVECDISGGLPAFDVVGLPDAAVKEARNRVRSAVKNSGFAFPVSRITVNLAPADRRKEGTVYDLPMLVGLLQGSGQLEADLEPWGFVGEVALSGQLRPVRGMLSMALAARRAGMRGLFVPADSASEAILAGEITVYPVETLNQLVEHLSGRTPDSPGGGGGAVGDGGRSARFRRREGPGAGQTGPGDRRRRRAPRADGGPSGGGEEYAGQAPALHPPDLTRQESLEATELWSVCGMTDSPPPTADQAALPGPPPHHLCPGPGRRRQRSKARRDLPGAPRGPLPGRAPRVPERHPGGAPPASGGRTGPDLPSVRDHDLSQPVYAGVRHEPVQMRLVRPPVGPVPVQPQRGEAVPEPDLRAADGPD